VNEVITLALLKGEITVMTEPTTRIPGWLRIDLAVIVLSAILIGIAFWIGLV
jgi:hypothetical protein